MKIKKTKDYKMFKFMNGNRDVDQAQINRLAKSLINDGNLMHSRPIIVNDKHEIVDGQHRVLAAEKVGAWVYYINTNKMGLEEVKVLNQNNRNWKSYDFAKAEASKGNENYRLWLEFKKIHKLGDTETTSLLRNSVSHKTKDFKKGLFKIYDLNLASKHMEWINDFSKFYKGSKRRCFIYSCIKIFNMPNYNHSQMKKKLKIKGISLQDAPTIEMNLTQLENLYNYRIKWNSPKYLRFK